MRRIKVILAVLAAVATMTVLAAPAMAQTTFTPASSDFGGNTFSGGSGFIDTGSGVLGGNFDSGSDGFSLGPFGTNFDNGNGQVCVCPGASSIDFD